MQNLMDTISNTSKLLRTHLCFYNVGHTLASLENYYRNNETFDYRIFGRESDIIMKQNF